MTETAIALLPSTADKKTWNPQQRALMESLGLKGEKNVQRNGSWVKEAFEAPDSIVEAFIYQIHRTGLDPVARQIYCIERGGKWGIQTSIDGFRLIAERSNEYRGQTPAQWTDGKIVKVPLREEGKVVRDGSGNPIMVEDYRWVDAWVASTPPAAARVGIYRDGFTEPAWGVATYDGYVAKDRNGKPTGQWESNSANQLAKCAEMLGLRKAFPQELSGLYGTEEMEQAGNPRGPAPAPVRASEPVIATVEGEDARDWGAEVAGVSDFAGLTKLANEAQAVGAMDVLIGDGDKSESVGHALWRRKAEFEKAATPLVESKVEKPVVRQWAREARDLTTGGEVFELRREAEALGADEATLEELATIAESKPNPSTPGEEWATPSTEGGAS